MDFVRDARISAANDRSPANCHPKPEMGTVCDHVARFTKCVAQCYFDRWHVRVHCRGNRAQPDIGYISSSLLAHRRAWRATTANGEHARWHGRARLRSCFKNRRALQRNSRSCVRCGGLHRRRICLGWQCRAWLHRNDSIDLHCLYSRRRKPQEKSRALVTSFADRWQSNTGCW